MEKRRRRRRQNASEKSELWHILEEAKPAYIAICGICDIAEYVRIFVKYA